MFPAAGLLGIAVFVFLAWAASSNRAAIPWRTVAWAMGLQWALALVVLKGPALARLLAFLPWPPHAGWGVLALTAGPLAVRRWTGGQVRGLKGTAAILAILALLRGNLVGAACQSARRVVESLMSFSFEGATFVFGPLAAPAGAAVRDPQGATVGGLGMVFAFSLVNSMIADICDEDELKTGIRREGIYFAVYNWWWKVAVSIATVISGYLQRYAGFVEGAGTQSESTLFQLRAWEIGLPPALCLISVWLLAKYPLTEDRAYEIKALLAARNAQPAADAAPAPQPA